MKLNIQNLTIKDLIAGVIVIGGLYMVARGINGTIGTLLILVVAFYFSRFRGQDNNKGR